MDTYIGVSFKKSSFNPMLDWIFYCVKCQDAGGVGVGAGGGDYTAPMKAT